MKIRFPGNRCKWDFVPALPNSDSCTDNSCPGRKNEAIMAMSSRSSAPTVDSRQRLSTSFRAATKCFGWYSRACRLLARISVCNRPQPQWPPEQRSRVPFGGSGPAAATSSHVGEIYVLPFETAIKCKSNVRRPRHRTMSHKWPSSTEMQTSQKRAQISINIHINK